MLTLNRVKLALLALFIAINGFFIYQYISSMEMAESVAVSVTIRNLNINTHAMPDIPQSVPVYNATNRWASPAEVATAILGDDCYMIELNMYQNDEYNLWVNNDTFSIYPQESISEPSESIPGTITATSSAKRWLRSHNIWGRNIASLGTSRDEETNDRVVSFADKLGRYTVLDSYVTVWINEREIRRITGNNWLSTEYVKLDSNVQLRSLNDLLARFAEARANYQLIEVSRVEFGYYLGARAPEIREVQTIPVVRLVTDIGMFYINAATGEEISEEVGVGNNYGY